MQLGGLYCLSLLVLPFSSASFPSPPFANPPHPSHRLAFFPSHDKRNFSLTLHYENFPTSKLAEPSTQPPPRRGKEAEKKKKMHGCQRCHHAITHRVLCSRKKLPIISEKYSPDHLLSAKIKLNCPFPVAHFAIPAVSRTDCDKAKRRTLL